MSEITSICIFFSAVVNKRTFFAKICLFHLNCSKNTLIIHCCGETHSETFLTECSFDPNVDIQWLTSRALHNEFLRRGQLPSFDFGSAVCLNIHCCKEMRVWLSNKFPMFLKIDHAFTSLTQIQMEWSQMKSGFRTTALIPARYSREKWRQKLCIWQWS